MNGTEGALLVLGASEEQVAIYEEARRRGLPTIGVDMRADRPGVRLTDEFLQISTADHRAIASALAGRRIAGVVSTASDACLESWHRLSLQFNTPWQYPAAAVAASMDKAKFHRIAAAAGVSSYPWMVSDRIGELAEAARDFRFPIVVKPTDAGGGRGICRLDTPGELTDRLADAARHSPSGRVIIEELLVGQHVTVNVFLLGGEIVFSVITDQHHLPSRNFLIGGHRAPARLEPATERALLADAGRLCAALGLADGPANFDVIITETGTGFVVEGGARLSGNGFPQLMLAMAGVDCVAALLDLAVGRPVQLASPARRVPSQLHVLTSPLTEPGELLACHGLAELAGVAGVRVIDLFVSPGDIIQPFTESGHKIGWIVVTADEPAMLQAVLDRALDPLRIVVKPLPRTPAMVNGTDPHETNGHSLNATDRVVAW